MGLFQDPNDPSNTYGQAVKDRISSYAQSLGNMLMGKGTGHDATAATQEAYRQYVIDAASRGETPMTLEQYNAAQKSSQQQNKLLEIMR